MTDKTLILEIPEKLLEKAEADQIDLRQTFIEALERKMQMSRQPQATFPDAIRPSEAEVEAAITASKARLAQGLTPRTIGYLQGEVWISDDFDDELPDAFWSGSEPLR